MARELYTALSASPFFYLLLCSRLVDNNILFKFFNFNNMPEKVVPVIDEESCTGCGGCEDLCREEAISMKKRGPMDPMHDISARVARINVGICTGCGDCVGQCGDITLPKEEE